MNHPHLWGEQCGRLLTLRGEDFSLVVVRQSFQLSQTLVCEILELLREFLLYQCGTSLSVGDFTIQVLRHVPISVEFSLPALLFLCHAFRKENFLFLVKDQDKILSLFCWRTPSHRTVVILGGRFTCWMISSTNTLNTLNRY